MRLSFVVDRARPVTRQIEEHLRAAIRDGTLGPGARMPSSRSLALELGVSRGVVVDAYEQLVSEGYLVARDRAVPVVADRPPRQRMRTPTPSRPLFDLRPDLPDLALFPRDDWLTASRAALARASNTDLAYGEPFGAARLRNELAPFLWRVRGVDADPRSIGIHIGSTQAISIVANVLRARGARRIAVEDPCHRWRRHTIRSANIEVVPVPVDEEGMRVDALRNAGADAVVVSPELSFPLGVRMSAARRADLLDWLGDGDRIVIEHDYDGLFRYVGEASGALQRHAPDRIAYIGTASALLAPTMRIGWSVLPEWLVEDVAAHMQQNVFSQSRIDQLTLSEALARGHVDRHLRQVTAVYRRRHAVAQELLPSSSEAAGLYLHVPLARAANEADVRAVLKAYGIDVGGANQHAMVPRDPGLVVGFASMDEDRLVEALSTLRRLAPLAR